MIKIVAIKLCLMCIYLKIWGQTSFCVVRPHSVRPGLILWGQRHSFLILNCFGAARETKSKEENQTNENLNKYIVELQVRAESLHQSLLLELLQLTTDLQPPPPIHCFNFLFLPPYPPPNPPSTFLHPLPPIYPLFLYLFCLSLIKNPKPFVWILLGVLCGHFSTPPSPSLHCRSSLSLLG